MDLCGIIYRYGHDTPGCIKSILFGDLFELYTVISNKVVGILIRARRHGLLDFEGEMLYQRQDDDVIIKLIALPGPVARGLGLADSNDQSDDDGYWHNGHIISKWNTKQK